MPISTALTPLDEAGLIQVLTEPKNALIKQFKSLFDMEDSEVVFTDDALKAIAHKAAEREPEHAGFVRLLNLQCSMSCTNCLTNQRTHVLSLTKK